MAKSTTQLVPDRAWRCAGFLSRIKCVAKVRNRINSAKSDVLIKMEMFCGKRFVAAFMQKYNMIKCGTDVGQKQGRERFNLEEHHSIFAFFSICLFVVGQLIKSLWNALLLGYPTINTQP